MKSILTLLDHSAAGCTCAWRSPRRKSPTRAATKPLRPSSTRPRAKARFPASSSFTSGGDLNDWVKDQAAKLAGEGYAALAIDLYRGKVGTTPEEAHEIMRGVPEDRANRDLEAAFQFLASQPNVKPDRIGAIGWCMGGGYALRPGAGRAQAGGLMSSTTATSHRSGRDQQNQRSHDWVLWRPRSRNHSRRCEGVRAAMDKAGKKIDVTIYPDAGHAFENPNNKDGYRPADAADAWSKTVNFLASTLNK